MFKKVLIVLVVAVLIGLGLNIGLMYAQRDQGKESAVDCKEILNKLDQILQNQEQMKEELAIIKSWV
jgi:hypothetical protein